MVLASDDLVTPSGKSASALHAISKIFPQFPEGIVELVALHPLPSSSFIWTDIPDVVRSHAEMRFYNGTELEDAYGVYGVRKERGAVAVVRPDGYIGCIASIEQSGRVDSYLRSCLRTV